jgi:predicted RNA-binding protein with PIN domain
MDFDWLIIDGYNLLHQDAALDGRRTDLQTARQRLVRRIERAAPEMAPRISVVFDGRESGRDAAFDAPHLEVLFSPANRTADAVIERMVAEAGHPEKICVVTSDRIEEQIVSAAGATVVSCEQFLSRCEAASPPGTRRPKPQPSTLGDFFPENKKTG